MYMLWEMQEGGPIKWPYREETGDMLAQSAYASAIAEERSA